MSQDAPPPLSVRLLSNLPGTRFFSPSQDEHHVLHMLDFFYFEEHLVIVSELLGDNLYEFSKAVKEAGHPEYFTLPRLCKIARQCLEVRGTW